MNAPTSHSPPSAAPIDAATLAPHYSRFRVTERLLLTGHSHQAWPDVAWHGVAEALEDAASHVDDKWERAFQKADRVRAGFRTLLGGIDGDLTLSANTHELLVRLLSALPWKERQEIVTTDGEFHTARRQLLRLAEEGVRVHWIPTQPLETLGTRLAQAITNKTALVFCSSVFFETARIFPELAKVAAAAAQFEAPFLIDTYHHLNVLPFNPIGLENAFILGGGYKYCQLGEGNCFLRSPRDCTLRPVITGWFADFSSLAGAPHPQVQYGSHPGARFAGATYDPISHYRAAAVFDFFEREGLTVERLRARSQAQLQLLATGIDSLRLPETFLTRDRETPLPDFGGFLSLITPHAETLERELLRAGVHTDHRGNRLRFGPAPYLSDAQIAQAVEILGRVASPLLR